MLLKLKGNNSAVDGVAFCVTPDDCILTYGDISKSLSSCDNDFLPRIIYDFFISFGGNVVFNGVNEGKSTQYITRNVNGYSVSLITDIEGITDEYKILIKN